MEKSDNRTVFVDIERAGKRRDSPIIELAAVATKSGDYEELARLEMKVEFSVKETDVKLLGLSKFSPSQWSRYAIPEKDAADKLAHFLRANATNQREGKNGDAYRLATLAGHNSEFDAQTLRTWFKKLDLFFPATRSPLDTLQLARWFFDSNQALVPPPDFKLSTLADYFSLRTTPNHEALSDVLASVELAQTIAHYTKVGIHVDAA